MNISKKPYKGCRDFYPKDMRVRKYIFQKIEESCKSFGFEEYDGPLLEEVNLYKAKSGEELINEQIYSFTDRGDREVAIRPEMTPTLARMVANIHRETPKPLRWFSIPNLMRYERPQKGRLREHWQFNADIFGAPEGIAELELFSLITHFFKSFGATSEMFSIQTNDRKIVDALFNDVLKLTKEQSYKLYKVIDKAKKIDSETLDKLILEIFSEEDKVSTFKKYLAINETNDLINFLQENDIATSGETYLKLTEKLKKLKLDQYIQYDPTIVRGLDYYTGVVFEVFDLNPANRRAIAGGGAYGNLLQIFNEPKLAGVGFGMGDVTLKDFLETHNLLPQLDSNPASLLLCCMDENDIDKAFVIAKELRENNISVELHLEAVKFNKAFKIAEKRNHSILALLGEDEIKNDSISIKNLQSKEMETFKLTEIQKINNFIS